MCCSICSILLDFTLCSSYLIAGLLGYQLFLMWKQCKVAKPTRAAAAPNAGHHVQERKEGFVNKLSEAAQHTRYLGRQSTLEAGMK